MMRDRSGSRAGFTLIEALVAFAIVAAATIVIQRSLVQSRFGMAAVADRDAAEWVARDLLATPLSRKHVSAGGWTGMSGGHRYEVRLSALDLPSPRSRSTMSGPPSEGRAQDETDTKVRWLPFRERITVETLRSAPVSVEIVKLGPVD